MNKLITVKSMNRLICSLFDQFHLRYLFPEGNNNELLSARTKNCTSTEKSCYAGDLIIYAAGKMSVEHRAVSRIFSTGAIGRRNESRKIAIPSAVIASASLIGAPVGDGIGTQLCKFNLYQNESSFLSMSRTVRF